MIIDFQEIWNARHGELDNFRATRRYVRSFRAITDSSLDGPAEIFTETQLPQLLANYEDANGSAIDPGAILHMVRIGQEQDDPFIWLVECEYSSEPLDIQQRNETIEDPLERPPIFSWGSENYQRRLDIDVFGNPVMNSARCQFSPLPEIDDSRPVLTMTRNEASPNFPLFQQYQDAINSDTVFGFGAGSCKIRISAQARFENNFYYWEVTYTFSFRAYVTYAGTTYSGWDTHLLDAGVEALDNNGNLGAIVLTGGIVASEPQLLDGKGHAQTNASRGVTSVVVTDGGASGAYHQKTPPTVIFTGGGGSGASAICVVGQGPYPIDTGLGPVVAIVVTNPGSGYTSAPTITFGLAPGDEDEEPPTATAVLGIIPAYVHYRPYNWLPYSVFGLPGAIV